MKNYLFGRLFKKLRMKAEMYRLADVADALGEEGIILETSLFSHWQKGRRVPRDRKLLLMLLKIFCARGGINNLDEANKWMASADQGFLTQEEVRTLNTPSVGKPHFILNRGLVYFARTKEELIRTLRNMSGTKSVNVVFYSGKPKGNIKHLSLSQVEN